ncbi:MAG: ATP-binding cassette domain-containing protein [Gammaproteobacteria bacterium]|nr:ATP-binding cassette domain-containing protein [Gemmatimonadota bacterium]NIU77369.1 ATP-binding cassette domain-containing protein [Gammaproteobacteria bacterium]NIY10952.1 ATP-binding cassette domain-containing protein [Gemmatimonadota bacterium]
MTRAFSIEAVVKAYGRRPVLKAASVWARSGSVTVVLGRNGCGKSTLLRIGAGVLAPDAGTVHYAGRVYPRPRLDVLARQGLFFLPDRHLLSARWTLRQHVEAFAWRFDDAGAARALARLRLEERLDQRPAELSGGERRRAELALAMMRRPRCLLADEPFAGINPSDGEALAAALREMARGGCAIVVTGHEVPQLLALADSVVWMVAGTTHGLGTPAEAESHSQFRREYLGPGWRGPEAGRP